MEQEPFNMFHSFFFITASCSYANIDNMTTFMPININYNALYESWLKHDESFTEIICSNEWNDYTMLEQRCIAFINRIQNDELTIGHVQLFPWTLIRETSIMFNILYYAGYDENIERIITAWLQVSWHLESALMFLDCSAETDYETLTAQGANEHTRMMTVDRSQDALYSLNALIMDDTVNDMMKYAFIETVYYSSVLQTQHNIQYRNVIQERVDCMDAFQYFTDNRLFNASMFIEYDEHAPDTDCEIVMRNGFLKRIHMDMSSMLEWRMACQFMLEWQNARSCMRTIERIPVRQVLAACRVFHEDAGMPVEYQREAFKALLAVESDSME